MANARLLLLAGAVAMVTAGAAFAQQTLTPNAPAPGDAATPANSGSSAPDQGNGAPGTRGATHTGRSSHSMASKSGMRGHTTDASQNDAVDRLNEQSFAAAQRGHSFTPAGGSSSGTMPSGNDMSQPSGPGRTQ